MRRAVLIALLAAAPARADVGAWTWLELRLRLRDHQEGERPGVSLRVFAGSRFTESAGGLAQSFLRVGPLLDLTPWLFLGIHGTVYADRRPDGSFDQEWRVEVEPNLHGRLGPFTFNDRNRFEYRWRSSVERFRYRNQFRSTTPRPARAGSPSCGTSCWSTSPGRG